MSIRTRCVSPGFTLIEVLIAMALLMALLGAMYGFLFDVLKLRRRALEHAQQHDAAAALITWLDADLMTCVIGDRVSGSGIAGDHTHLRVLTRSVAANLAAHGEDDPDVLGDLQFADYRLNAQAKRIEGRRGPARVGAPTANFSVLEGTIHKLRFRYYDGTAWQSAFDSLIEKRLPIAIEVAIWFNPPPGDRADEQVFDPPVEHDDKRVSLDRTQEEESERPEVQHRASESHDQPPPDRVRVFIIPDAAGEEAPSTVTESTAVAPVSGHE